jgi:hypothetical protein
MIVQRIDMTPLAHAKLVINDEPVGDVFVQGTEDSWSHGRFDALQAFAKFAPLFGRWSLMMHVDGTYVPLSEAAGDELRRTEIEIDRLRAKLHFAGSDTWVTCRQLNIDGPLIEWKSS